MSFLRTLFGPSKDEVWRQFADAVGASVIPGRLWNPNKIQAHVDQWTLTLDIYTISTGETSTTYTRMRAPYVNRDGFRFTIYRRNVFSPVAAWIGGQDITIGDPQFDHDFIIKSNDDAKVGRLFANTRIRELVQMQPGIRLDVKDDEGWFVAFPEGVDELCFQTPGVIRDLTLLKSLYDVFAEVLHELCRMGSAYERDPGVVLK